MLAQNPCGSALLWGEQAHARSSGGSWGHGWGGGHGCLPGPEQWRELRTEGEPHGVLQGLEPWLELRRGLRGKPGLRGSPMEACRACSRGGRTAEGLRLGKSQRIKLKEGGFRLHTGRKFFTVRAVRHLLSLPSPSNLKVGGYWLC